MPVSIGFSRDCAEMRRSLLSPLRLPFRHSGDAPDDSPEGCQPQSPRRLLPDGWRLGPALVADSLGRRSRSDRPRPKVSVLEAVLFDLVVDGLERELQELGGLLLVAAGKGERLLDQVTFHISERVA